MAKRESKKQRIFSGIQPSGNLHIGNYLGAIKQFVELQKENDAIFCIVDQHAITVPQNPKELRAKTLEVAMLYLACGIDSQKSIIFAQSRVPAHTELGWMLTTLTPLGELERMTQYKDKSQETKDKRQGVYAGLFSYPVLMASDILLYQTDAVPVGEDQRQHIEFTRMIGEKFNNRFGQTFKLPKELINKNTARIMGLEDPEKKMSKSAGSADNCISILEEPDEIRRKIKIAVTDSGSEVKFDPREKPAISNLMALYRGFSGKGIKEIEAMHAGKGYADFKKNLAEIIVSELEPIQKKFKEFSRDKKEVLDILKQGAKKAEVLAEKTLTDAKEKMGFLLN